LGDIFQISPGEVAVRRTKYATEVVEPAVIDEYRIERIFVNETQKVEVRFSWWKNGRFAIRPLDLPETELLPLLMKAFDCGVLSQEFRAELVKELAGSK
jgi:hypothetical protein